MKGFFSGVAWTIFCIVGVIVGLIVHALDNLPEIVQEVLGGLLFTVLFMIMFLGPFVIGFFVYFVLINILTYDMDFKNFKHRGRIKYVLTVLILSLVIAATWTQLGPVLNSSLENLVPYLTEWEYGVFAWIEFAFATLGLLLLGSLDR